MVAFGLICWPAVALSGWETKSYTDQMTSKVVREATATSTNTVEFNFPYGGPQRAFLQLRIHPRYGNSVILSMNKAQFLCQMDGCEVLVRFDGGEAKLYEASEPADHSTNALFIRDFDTFVPDVMKAKWVKIEAKFYQSGSRVFTFNVSKLPTIFSEESVKAKLQEQLQRKAAEQRHEDAEQRAKEAEQKVLRREEDARGGEELKRVEEKRRVDEAKPEGDRKQRELEETKRRAGGAAGAAQQKLSDDWKARIQAKIRSRIVVPPNMEGNPEARFEVVLLPGGEVLSATLKKSSGNPAYDAAIERAIAAAQPLPVPTDTDLFQENFREFSFSIRPEDSGILSTPETTAPNIVVQRRVEPSIAAPPVVRAAPATASTVQPPLAVAPPIKAVDESRNRTPVERYQQIISARIKQYEEYPPVAKKQRWEGTTVVWVRLAPDGNVTNLSVAETSGYEILDEAAFKMIQKASPLPAPPESLRGREVTVPVPIVFRLAR